MEGECTVALWSFYISGAEGDLSGQIAGLPCRFWLGFQRTTPLI